MFVSKYTYRVRNKNRALFKFLTLVLYESLVMSTMFYGAELWPLTVAQKKKARSHTARVPKKNDEYLMERQSQ